MGDLFASLQEAGSVRAEISDAAWLQALLDVEVGLAWALADCGLVPAEDAARIAAHGAASAYSAAELGAAAVGAGNPVVPLVGELRRRVGEPVASTVHRGATSQDVMDSAAMLVARRALDVLLVDLRGCSSRLVELVSAYGQTVQAGRTLLQQAAPTTFGLTAAGWLSGLLRAETALRAARAELAVQYGGAVGNLAALGTDGPRVAAALAARLELAEPLLPWHTERSRIAALAGAAAQTAGAVAAVARSITLLAASEVGELCESGPAGTGGSSTLPQKQNPIAAVLALGCAAQAPGLAATLYAAMGQEHQRAAGAWHAEWRALRELLGSTGSAVHWLRVSLTRLSVDTDRMDAAVSAARGPLAAERIAGALTPRLGRAGAQEAVARCARRAAAEGSDLLTVLAANPEVSLSVAELAQLTDPAAYVGAAGVFVERVLAEYRRRDAS